jgi:hypothetical protein
MSHYLVCKLFFVFGKDDVRFAERNAPVQPSCEVILRRFFEPTALNIDSLELKSYNNIYTTIA